MSQGEVRAVPNQRLFTAVAAWVAATYPGRLPRRVTVRLDDGEAVSLVVPATAAMAHQQDSGAFSPTPLQDDILDALAGKALRTDALAAKCDTDRRNLFRPGGLKELQAAGWVAHHKRYGFYRPDDPPPEIVGDIR